MIPGYYLPVAIHTHTIFYRVIIYPLGISDYIQWFNFIADNIVTNHAEWKLLMAELQPGVIEARFADMIWEREPVSSSELVKLAADVTSVIFRAHKKSVLEPETFSNTLLSL